MAIWHAVRAGGFGGSEIGVLVRNHGGVRADHQASAHDIVEGKLLRRTPSESNAHLRRGHENEDLHAQRFYAKYGASRDLAAYDALKSVTGRHPWMRYSPDDVVSMNVQMVMAPDGQWQPAPCAQPKRWLIDYKSPSKVEPDDEIAFQYACQLIQGAILSAEAEIVLDGLMLSQSDWANWCLKDDVVTWNEQIGKMVIDSGDHYWDFVLRGEVPAYIRTPMMDGMDDYLARYSAHAEAYAAVQGLKDAAEKRAAQIKALMLDPIAKMRFGDAKLAFGAPGNAVLTVSTMKMLDREAAYKVLPPASIEKCAGKLEYDPDAMAAKLSELGFDPKQFRKRDLDAVKVYAEAASLGLDPDLLVREQFTFKAGQSVKDTMANYIDEHYPLTALMSELAADPSEQAAPQDAPINTG
jgi:hypothetical protein